MSLGNHHSFSLVILRYIFCAFASWLKMQVSALWELSGAGGETWEGTAAHTSHSVQRLSADV